MQKKHQQLKTFFQQNKLFFLCLLLLFALPIYSGEILANSHAYIFGKYINYLHIRLSLHLILSLAVVYQFFKGKSQAFLATKQKTLLAIAIAAILFALLPLYNILQLPVVNHFVLYFSSLFHLGEFAIIATALIITIKTILTAKKEFAPFIYIAIAFSVVLQGAIGLAQFILKGPLLPQLLTWTGQPLEFTSNSILGIFEYARIYGTTPHPNILAGILTFFAFLTLSLLIPKAPKFGLLAVISLILLGTMSKAGLLAFALIFLIYSLRRLLPHFEVTSKSIILWFIFVNILILGLFALSQAFATSFTFVESRAVIQQLYLELVASRPLLLLFGTGFTLSIPTLLANTTPLHTSIIWGNQILAEPVHNVLLLTIIELGIPGFIIALLSTFSLLPKYFNDLESWKKLGLFTLLLTLGVFDHFLLY